MNIRRKTLPNLPLHDARLMLVSEALSKESAEKLRKLGVELIYAPRFPLVDPRIDFHTDIGICHAAPGLVAACPMSCSAVQDDRFEVVSGYKDPVSPHPLDSLYNACIIGKYAIHDFRYTDKKLLEILSSRYELVQVRQSYSKCLISPVTSDFVITQDGGIARMLEKRGLDVLEIHETGILLEGFGHGFIGGASFMYNMRTWTLNGSAERLDSCYNIEKGLMSAGIGIMCLNDGRPEDVGSFMILLEEGGNEEKPE